MRQRRSAAWRWLPTLYFAEGLPYAAVMTLSVIMYKRLDISNTDIALYTGWLYLPWVIKPMWSPFVDIIKTKRWWIFSMQLLIGAGLAGIAMTIPAPSFFRWTLAVFWLISFSSATHDIAADGFYMLALDTHDQALFVGIRNTFYRVATFVAQGALVVVAGRLEKSNLTGGIPYAWSLTFFILAGFFIFVALYHRFVLPYPSTDRSSSVALSPATVFREFLDTFTSFFKKRDLVGAIAFMLLYRLPEAQLVKMINPFLLDPLDKGGLALSTEQVGWIYGTLGVIGLTLGGILGGIAASIGGLGRWLWTMMWSLTLPCVVYLYMSAVQTDSLWIICVSVFIEQFGYGFGYTAYLLFMMYFVENDKYKTAHYAICTAFMALGMMLPGMAAGWLQESLGYTNFFIWIMISCIATIVVTAIVRIDPSYGKRCRVKTQI